MIRLSDFENALATLEELRVKVRAAPGQMRDEAFHQVRDILIAAQQHCIPARSPTVAPRQDAPDARTRDIHAIAECAFIEGYTAALNTRTEGSVRHALALARAYLATPTLRDAVDAVRERVPSEPMTLRQMQEVNAARSVRWMAGSPGWTTLEIAGELAGEVGELANVCKKLRRSEMGVPGNKVSDAELLVQARSEAADVLIVLMLTTTKLGIDLQDAVRDTFNAKSEQMGFPERFDASPALAPPTPEPVPNPPLLTAIEANAHRVARAIGWDESAIVSSVTIIREALRATPPQRAGVTEEQVGEVAKYLRTHGDVRVYTDFHARAILDAASRVAPQGGET